MHKKISGVILNFEERVNAKNAAIAKNGQTKEEQENAVPEQAAQKAETVTTKTEANTPVENVSKAEVNTPKAEATKTEEKTINASSENITDEVGKENLNFDEMINLISQIEDEDEKKAKMKKLLEALYNLIG